MDIVRAPSTEGLKLREINRAGQEEFASLVSRCFGYAEDQQDFLRDFPVWNQDLNSRVERLGYYHEGKLIAAVAGRTCTLRGIVQGTPIGIIGAVVTSPEWRGNRLATHLVREMSQRLESKGVSGVFLWSNRYDLYRTQGFEACGIQGRVPLVELGLEPPQPEVVGRGWRDDLFTLMKSKFGGIELSDEDLRWIKGQETVDWRWTVGEDGRVSAYAAFGRGMDLRGIVHDYAGDEESLRAILSQIASEHEEAELLYHPTYLPFDDFDPREGRAEFLCLGKVFRPEAFIRALAAKSTQVTRTEMGEYELNVEGVEAAGLKPRELARILFGPDAPVYLGESTLPLPLWFWGLDSA